MDINPSLSTFKVFYQTKIEASSEEVWKVISAPGNLNYCHPFCKSNLIEKWGGVGAKDTIEYYNERKEMLLNYPVFQKKITRILEDKGEIKLDELGVSEKYGREYLKMYLRTTYTSLTLEETADSLRRSQ